MKMNEIKLMESEFLTNEDEIIKWIVENFNSDESRHHEQLNINDLIIKDGVVSTKDPLIVKSGVKIPKLKVQFGKVCLFSLQHCGLTSMKGFPKETITSTDSSIDDYVDITDNPIKDLDFDNMSTDEFVFTSTQVTSLKGIHKKFKKCGKLFLSSTVKSHILGTMLIPGITMVHQQTHQQEENKDLTKALDIIMKYLKDGKAGVIDAQNEMVDAGLEEYAQL